MRSAYLHPLHQQVEQKILLRLGSTYPRGGRLPTEQELADEFEVSLNTIRRAMRSLAEKGWVQRSRGRGSFVSDPLPGAGR